MTGFSFETLGNATIQLFRGSQPILATDPWLVGTCYFGSWALDHPLSEAQKQNVINSEFIWISHGHPDHLHQDSLRLLHKSQHLLIPNFYSKDIHTYLCNEGFDVTVMPYKTWIVLGNELRIMSIDNNNQDAILVIEAGDSLLINQNDSPLSGEGSFLRRLVRDHPNRKTYILALCSIDADMLNFVDSEDNRMTLLPSELKPGKIHEVAIRAAKLGISNFCCSSSQHIYIRKDSAWANNYRMVYRDMISHWCRPNVNLIEPFVTVDLETGNITRNHPSQTSNISAITDETGDDDWGEQLSGEEWALVGKFVAKFELMGGGVQFVEFTVGGVTRRFYVGKAPMGWPFWRKRGLRFSVPRRSLLQVIECGYFDDLLIANFMRTELKGARLSPHFTSPVAKLGGNARVFTRKDYRRFRSYYFRRSPRTYVTASIERAWRQVVSPFVISVLSRFGVRETARQAFRALKRVPR
jgi:hypothetical protein